MRSLIAAVLVTAGLVLGLGQATAQEATPAAADSGDLTYTNVRFFLPYTPDGLAPGLNVTEEVSGACLELSLADIGRSDAWVCAGAMNDELYDPCFENPFGAMDEQNEVICAASPFSTDVLRFTLTEPLQHEKQLEADEPAPPPPPLPDQDPPRKGKKHHQDAAPPVPAVAPDDVAALAINPLDIPWAIELANGERCTLLTGATAVVADERINYGCESGGYVIGELDRTRPVWMASFLANDAFASDLVPVAVAWT